MTGELTHGLLHPSGEVEKGYLVWVTGDVDRALPALLSGPHGAGRGAHVPPGPVRMGRREGCDPPLVVIHQRRTARCAGCAGGAGGAAASSAVQVGRARLGLGLEPGQWRPLTGEELRLLPGRGGVAPPDSWISSLQD